MSLILVGLALLGSASTVNAQLFDPAVNYQVGSGSEHLAIGDLDGDGNPDLAVSNHGSDDVSILLGIGDGTFATEQRFSVGGFPETVAIADFDGDGDRDLATANRNSNNVSILLNNGDGTFAAATNFPVGSGPALMAVGDLDGDGDADLAEANRNSSTVSVLLNNGDGTFAAAVSLPVGPSPIGVAIGDLDGDGDGDLAVTNFGSTTVSILMNNGDATFAAAVNFTAGSGPEGVAIADLDGDGDEDLATANANANTVSVLLNNGDGSFAAALDFLVGSRPVDVAIGDLDGDGDADLAVTNTDSNDISVLLNDGNGAFATAVNFAAAGSGTFGVAIGDLDGDGDGDLAVANLASSTVSVLLNRGITINDGLVAFWQLDGDAHDATGNNHDGTLFGTTPTTDRFGNAGHALLFDGLSDHIVVPATSALSPPIFSVSAWVMASDILDASNSAFVITSDPNGNACAHGYQMWLEKQTSGSIRPFVNADPPQCGSGGVVISDSPIDGTWHHLALTYDGTVRMYVDGVLQSTTTTPNYAPTNGPVTIGALPVGGGSGVTWFYFGALDDIRVYDRALSSGEIVQLFRLLPQDCNANGIPDATDIDNGTSQDCNTNGIPDECDISDGTSPDCNANGVPDECDIADASSSDDVGAGGSPDGIPDECQLDCNGNLIPDDIDISDGTSLDCNSNGIPDECDTPDVDAPVIVHTSGPLVPGEPQTRPCSGFIDPRAESTNGIDLDQGLDRATLVFSEEVRSIGGGPLDADSFMVTETGAGQPPNVETVLTVVNPDGKEVVTVVLNRPITLQEWTTIRAEVEDRCGNPIPNEGDLGPDSNEPDRVDVGFLPADVDQNASVGPFDLLMFRQFINGIAEPSCGASDDFVDTNRDGEIGPGDLLRFRQAVNGVLPSTRPWAFEVMNNDRP